MAKKKDTLVPYDQVPPGFEAMYTGETSSTPVRESQMTSTLYSDEDGNLISRGCTFPWFFPNEEGHWKEDEWDDTVKHLNQMQSKLGPLTDNIRLLRCHITSLIPCDSGLPITVDEILFAIARGKLERSSFKNGCMCGTVGCQLKTSQPGQAESHRTIHAVLNAYLAGEPREDAIEAHPEATGFIERSYQWLGAVADLSKVQRKMLDRVLLTIDLLTRANCTAAGSQSSMDEFEPQDMEALSKDVFYDENGRGGFLRLIPGIPPHIKKRSMRSRMSRSRNCTKPAYTSRRESTRPATVTIARFAILKAGFTASERGD
jgi:hypothetical protein